MLNMCPHSALPLSQPVYLLLNLFPLALCKKKKRCTICHAIFNLCATMDWQLDGLVASQVAAAASDCCVTAALLLPYCCFTAALLLLYCCFTAEGVVASQLVQTMEELIEELAVVMNERALQVAAPAFLLLYCC